MPSPDFTLSEDAAQRAWLWVLARSGLTSHRTAADAVEISERTLGLHAARVGSPFATVISRISEYIPREDAASLLADERLVTIRCMRRTLHTLPIELASICHSATLHYRRQHVWALAARAGVPNSHLAALASHVEASLRDTSFVGHRAIERLLVADGATTDAARLALKLAWEEGRICYRNRAPSWHREIRTFSHHKNVPGFRTLHAEQAKEQLIVAYFERFGPATLRDASWWSGLGQRFILNVLVRRGAVSLETPWAESVCFLLPHQIDGMLKFDDDAETVHFLAHEEVVLKAYFESRTRYLGSLRPDQAFNAIGEVRPTILDGGRVVGTWQWNAKSRRVNYRVWHATQCPDPEKLRVGATRTTYFLRSGYDAAVGAADA